MTTREKCSLCGREVLYKTVSTASFDDPTSTQAIADRCPNPACENSDPRYHTFDWAVPL